MTIPGSFSDLCTRMADTLCFITIPVMDPFF